MRLARTNKGFTLVELMVTVAVMAILLTVAIPAFQSTLDKRRLVGAAEQLYADMQYARTEAIKRNAKVHISFTTGANWCYGLDTSTCNCATANDCQLDGINKVVSSSDFRGITLEETFDGGTDTLFEPRRGTAPDKAGTAKLISSTMGEIHVVVSSLGRVKICSPSGAIKSKNYPTC